MIMAYSFVGTTMTVLVSGEETGGSSAISSRSPGRPGRAHRSARPVGRRRRGSRPAARDGKLLVFGMPIHKRTSIPDR